MTDDTQTTTDPASERSDGGVPVEKQEQEDEAGTMQPFGVPRWVMAVVPIVLLLAVLGVFVATTPLAGLQDQYGGEALPDLSISHSTIPSEDTVVLHVTNNGPEPVTISQVLVEDAYWNFDVKGAGGDNTLAPRESARVEIPYHWNEGWDLEVALVASDGTTFHHDIEAPSQSPGFSLGILGTLALIGLFVGVIPVALGMLWFPYLQGMSDRALHAVLLFAVGVLSFLAFDAGFEAFELAESIPGAYEGDLLVVFGILGALLLVQSISAWREGRARTDGGPAKADGGHAETDGGSARSGLWVAYLVALGIGLHNLAEGLAIGSSFALGRVSLGAFLVIGFMLHNVTEGPAVVAPVANEERPHWKHFVALGAIAGGPVILGGWIGSFAFSPTVGAFFLAIGVGAILQVNWEIAGMVRNAGGRIASATNLLAFFLGLSVMYATDLFVAL